MRYEKLSRLVERTKQGDEEAFGKLYNERSKYESDLVKCCKNTQNTPNFWKFC